MTAAITNRTKFFLNCIVSWMYGRRVPERRDDEQMKGEGRAFMHTAILLADTDLSLYSGLARRVRIIRRLGVSNA